MGTIKYRIMKNLIGIIISLIILTGCDKPKEISGQLDVPGSLFEYSAEGTGTPLVVFTGGENIGHKLIPKTLKDHFVIIHADPSNVDTSIIEEITLDDILDDLENLRLSIGIEKIGILGHSMFGTLPMEYAVKYPENTSFIISTGSQPFNNDISAEASRSYWEEKASKTRKQVRDQNWKELEDLNWNALSPTQQFITSYTADTPFRFYDPNFDQSSFWKGIEINMAFLSHYGGTLMKDFDHSERYQEIEAPILVLTGKYDFGASYYLWEKYESSIPDFTLKVYEHAGHNPFMEYPEEFARDVLEWVRSKS
jgi:proline iminopeptidase